MSYSHRFHAGNHADVFKHLALVALLEASTRAGAAPVTYLETHAGEGRYTLGPTGEWTEGIGKLDR
ncbi:MAG: 23S rRNA (adenine(2030)-N(6))-methyltransferase RlmJ, partial [Bradymonadia bacterium]